MNPLRLALVVGTLLPSALATRALAQATTLASVDASCGQANNTSDFTNVVPGGRYVMFWSLSTNLVPGDVNGIADIFMKDRWTGAIELLSVSSGGVQADAPSDPAALSADGRHAAFSTLATNLVAGDTNGFRDILVRDRVAGTTVRVSVDSSGAQANGNSIFPSITADGRYVAFRSGATNLVAGDTNAQIDIFVHDRDPDANAIFDEGNGVTTRVSVDSFGAQSNGTTDLPCFSADGRYVAFSSPASNLVAGDTNGFYDIYVHDRLTATTTRASVGNGGVEGNNGSFAASVSSDGRYIAFESASSNFALTDTNGTFDVFVRDTVAGTTTLASADSLGAAANNQSRVPSLSGDGRYVVFHSPATNLVTGDTNGFNDIFLRDLLASTTTRISTVSSVQGNADSLRPELSSDGAFVVFHSLATNLVLGDANGFGDVLVHDLGLSPPQFPSFCSGDGTAGPCPCGNAGTTGRGCENSASTGGASLSALGASSPDTVLLISRGELPVAFTIFLQGDATVAATNFGDGLRCTGGNLKRLTLTSANGGVAMFPLCDSQSVTGQSAALGDPIAPGTSRHYQAYYRDPVSAHCPDPPGSTFNVSNAITITW